MTIQAALLDDADVYLRMDELADESALTPRHLPQITVCDLPPGQYKWIAGAGEFGGAFWPLSWLERVAADAAAVQASAKAAEKLAARRAARKTARQAEEARRQAILRGEP